MKLGSPGKERPLINKNTEWLASPGSWIFVVCLIVLAWLVTSLFVDGGLAWSYVHLIHGGITYYLLHWQKGSPVPFDQGKYARLTFWEQLDDGIQNTATRKFFLVCDLVLFLLAAHGTDYARQPLGLNLGVLLVLLVAKTPFMHRVRILGINKY